MDSGSLFVNNGKKFKESVLNLQICFMRGYIFNRNIEEFSKGIKCVRDICDFEESMFDLGVLGLYFHPLFFASTCNYMMAKVVNTKLRFNY